MVPLHQQIHDLVAGVNIAATTRSSGESGTWGHAQQHGVETLRLPSKRCVRAQSEALAGLAPAPAASSPFEREVLSGLRFARTCYEHLAGRLGVALHDRLLEMDLIRGDGVEHRVTPAGEAWFTGLSVDVQAARRARRSFARSCLDWSERKSHLAGALGDALLEALVERAWIHRLPGERAMELTEAGADGLAASLGLTWRRPRPA